MTFNGIEIVRRAGSNSLGNGLAGAYSYDALGRLSGGTVSSGGTQIYGFADGWRGQQLTGSSDSVLGQGSTYGYDEFNRLTSLTVNAGTGPNYGWVYDRYGNRLQQNITGGTGSGSTFTASVNAANNQLVGYTYDAAGNMTNDGFHSYTYDAEGHITAVDGGQTASYVYNALNQRVRTVVGSTITDYVFNAAGQRVSEWSGTTHLQLKGKYYWGAKPVAYYANGATHFEHQNWLGTERMRTTYNGAVEGGYGSLPFGDGQGTTGADTDANHYATLDHDVETDTDYAEFRQYSNAQGRWLSPDPYHGSYKMRNPQSFNRYVYVGNNPLAGIDPTGLQLCSNSSCDWNKSGGSGGNDGPGVLYPGTTETSSTYSGSDADAGTDGFGDEQLPSFGNSQPNVVLGPQLSYNTVSGGQDSNSWVVQWQVTPASSTGGLIVQNITITDPSGNQSYNYWEAWTVPANSQYTSYFPDPTDDTFRAPSGSTINSSAAFYPATQLPASFIPNNPSTPPAGILPATTVNPNLPNPSSPTTNTSPPVNRTWTAP